MGYTVQFGETRKSVVGLSGVAIGLGKLFLFVESNVNEKFSFVQFVNFYILCFFQERYWVRRSFFRPMTPIEVAQETVNYCQVQY